jgi:CBS domain-containing protein
VPINWIGSQGHSPYALRPRIRPSEGGVEHPEATTTTRGIKEEAERGRRERLVKAYTEEPVESSVGAMLAAKAMTAPVITLSPETPLSDALQLSEIHVFRYFPVVTNDRALVGMISDRDLLRWTPSEEEESPKVVGDLMAREFLTATIDTVLRNIARVMVDEGARSLPIVNSSQHVVGILTHGDVLRCIVEHAPLSLRT